MKSKQNNFFANRKHLAIALVALAVIIGGATLYSMSNSKIEPYYSKASQASPVGFSIAVRDILCSDQDGASLLITAGSSGFATDRNEKDPDCASIFFDPGDTGSVPLKQGIYDQDFRIGIAVAESEKGCTRQKGNTMWTPWASARGGASLKAIPFNKLEAPDCLWLSYEIRPLPPGVMITDARVGIATGTGSWSYTPWARQGGGWSEFQPQFRPNQKFKKGYEPIISPARVILQAKVSKVKNSMY